MNYQDWAGYYYHHGLCPVPIAPGDKFPPAGCYWSQWQNKPAWDSIKHWWNNDANYVGILTGHPSENLEVIDCDDPDIWSQYIQEASPDLQTLIRSLPLVKTGKSWHIYYRCPTIQPNQPLAKCYDVTRLNGKRVLIETRGIGGLVVAPPSWHPIVDTQYTWKQHMPNKVPTITETERKQLVTHARRFHECHEPILEKETRAKRTRQVDLPPHLQQLKNEFNKYNSWQWILSDWEELFTTRNNITHWSRPNHETNTTSATTNFDGQHDLLHVFSSNAPLPEGTYDKYAAYCLMYLGGRFADMPSHVWAMGLNQPRKQKTEPNEDPVS